VVVEDSKSSLPEEPEEVVAAYFLVKLLLPWLPGSQPFDSVVATLVLLLLVLVRYSQ
jgi:hypothetical protein